MATCLLWAVSWTVVSEGRAIAQVGSSDVVIRGGRSDVERQRESAEAVSVQETGRAKRESADMGDVLSRSQGVSIVRAGGLGSEARLSLDGLSDQQIRVFVDGIPLEVAGFPFDVSSIPVGLVNRIEVYHGVVPLRFGADALGGAVNLVTTPRYYDTGGTVSYQNGSFSTYRATGQARYRSEATGVFVAGTAFVDATENNYLIDTRAPDLQGRLHDVRVPRFHDAYASRGAYVDLGLVDRPWADRAIVRVFRSSYDKELQSNTLMSIPYGAVHYDESLTGITARWTKTKLAHGLVDMDAVLAMSRRETEFVDVSPDVYGWFGNVVHTKAHGGEINGFPRDTSVTKNTVLGRVVGSVHLTADQTLRLAASPTHVTSQGASRVGVRADQIDPLAAERNLTSLVVGAEHEAHVLGDLLENVVMLKGYWFRATSSAVLTDIVLAPVDASRVMVGAGDGVRVRVSPSFLVKASYEYTARIPSADEIFGNGVLVQPNGPLQPERSHNANLGFAWATPRTAAGRFTGEANGFLRRSQNLILLLGNQFSYAYENVLSARTVGAEIFGSWLSPGGYLSVSSSGTYQDTRNVSSEGPFADYQGNRLPNTPYLFGHASARARIRSTFAPDDDLSVTFGVRYVHEFYRTWESLGAKETKLTIDAQVVASAGLAWTVNGPVTVTSVVDIQNLTNTRVYDVFGVQRPGRALFVKSTIDLLLHPLPPIPGTTNP